jgi:hypothetical protein
VIGRLRELGAFLLADSLEEFVRVEACRTFGPLEE